MSFYCKNCKKIVGESELLGTGEFFRGREHGACPHCHSENLVEAGKCELCGAEISPYEQLCDNCKQQMLNAWDKAVYYVMDRYGKHYEKAERILLEFMEREVF